MGAHALLAPSAAKRWMSCPAAARLEAAEPSKDTVYTREGTIAHAFAENCLRALLASGAQALPEEPDKESIAQLRTDCGVEFDAEEIASQVWHSYVTIVFEDYLRLAPEATLLIEHKFNLDEYVPQSFGSSDAVIITPETLHVYDLKYGKGVKVSALENPQMRNYALGVWLSFGRDLYTEVEKVMMTIIQPRLGWVSSDEMTTTELLDWANLILKPAAELAWRGTGPAIAGGHCKFCRVAHKCKALAEYAEHIAQTVMTPEEMAATLRKAPTIKAWLEALESNALAEALEGRPLPGFKLVEGRSVRTFSDKEAVLTRLKESIPDSGVYMTKPELKSITDLEKALTKKGFNALLGDYVVKPKGKPTLAPEEDPREPMNRPEDDFKEILNNQN